MAEAREPVILVHGLWMTGLEFGVLRQRLQTRHGFDVHVFSYPSMHGNVDVIVGELGELAQRLAAGAGSGDTIVANRAYPAPGVYRVRLYSPADSPEPQDTVNVVVLSAPGRAPAKPADLRGEPTNLDIRTAAAAYTAYVVQNFPTLGGVLPAHKVGVDPLTGVDRYVSDVTPQTTFLTGETNIFGAAYVSAIPLQMAYSATADMDLAPRGSPPQTSRLFQSDAFVPLSSPGFDPAINVNNQGFKQEDFNYSLVPSLWENTRDIYGTNGYSQDPQSGLYNRRFMEESLQREISRAMRKQAKIGIIMGDLDHFKKPNRRGSRRTPRARRGS